MAAQKQIGLVVVNTQAAVQGGTPMDRVRVYIPDKRFPLTQSWANTVVPKLLRQQKGELQKGEWPYQVILHNGAQPGALCGHFDATTPLENV